MSTESTLAFFSGNDVLLKFHVTDEDSPPNDKDLTAATDITFIIAKSQGKVPDLTLTLGSGIVNTGPTTGDFEVTITKAQTEPLGVKHTYFEVRITDSNTKTSTVAFGTAVIQPNSITT